MNDVMEASLSQKAAAPVYGTPGPIKRSLFVSHPVSSVDMIGMSLNRVVILQLVALCAVAKAVTTEQPTTSSRIKKRQDNDDFDYKPKDVARISKIMGTIVVDLVIVLHPSPLKNPVWNVG
ncbi:hypothetical protein AAG570_000691 [Ranatra chinensis]|uniref:Uncharacterized protein n=1 Tax=Ranatra chinensis TaxID=642074 RepID=A0ABD0YXS8_9HEMI